MRLKSFGPLFAVLLVTPFVTQCGDSAGYLSDNTTCSPDYDSIPQDSVDYDSLESLAYMYGTSGSYPRLAQYAQLSESMPLIWGVQLRLQADSDPSKGVGVALTRTSVDIESDDSSQVATSSVGGGAIPSDTGWVTFKFNTVAEKQSGYAYWLELTPKYPHAEVNRVGWGYLTGSGLYSYSIEDLVWTSTMNRAASYRFIGCE